MSRDITFLLRCTLKIVVHASTRRTQTRFNRTSRSRQKAPTSESSSIRTKSSDTADNKQNIRPSRRGRRYTRAARNKGVPKYLRRQDQLLSAYLWLDTGVRRGLEYASVRGISCPLHRGRDTLSDSMQDEGALELLSSRTPPCPLAPAPPPTSSIPFSVCGLLTRPIPPVELGPTPSSARCGSSSAGSENSCTFSLATEVAPPEPSTLPISSPPSMCSPHHLSHHLHHPRSFRSWIYIPCRRRLMKRPAH